MRQVGFLPAEQISVVPGRLWLNRAIVLSHPSLVGGAEIQKQRNINQASFELHVPVIAAGLGFRLAAGSIVGDDVSNAFADVG